MAENQAGAKPVESFEACLDELEKVVKELEGGDLPLERSLELFERGMRLSETCRKQLEEAETRVEMLIRKDGQDHRRAVPPGKVLTHEPARIPRPAAADWWMRSSTAWSRRKPRRPETIHRAMRYSLFAGGKRIRPILCIEAARSRRR